MNFLSIAFDFFFLLPCCGHLCSSVISTSHEVVYLLVIERESHPSVSPTF